MPADNVMLGRSKELACEEVKKGSGDERSAQIRSCSVAEIHQTKAWADSADCGTLDCLLQARKRMMKASKLEADEVVSVSGLSRCAFVHWTCPRTSVLHLRPARPHIMYPSTQ